MKKEYVLQCMELTEEILVSTYQGDISLAIQYIHDDCLWIGPLGNQYMQGSKEIFKNVKEQRKGIPKVYLQAKKFLCVAQERNGCIISGKFFATTGVDSHELFRQLQRSTFVWKMVKGNLHIVHIHISSPQGLENENYKFQHKIGIYTKEYLNMLIKREIEKSGSIIVKDQRNIHHVIQVSDIIYCESFDANTVIHTLKDVTVARVMLSKMEEILNEKDEVMFLRVHKSFIVNKYYINTIHRYELEMMNGYKVPVAKQRYLTIKEKLYK